LAEFFIKMGIITLFISIIFFIFLMGCIIKTEKFKEEGNYKSYTITFDVFGSWYLLILENEFPFIKIIKAY